MNYGFMIDTAVDVIRKRYDKRHNPVVGDTVCVICAGNGNIYTASNEYVNVNGITENVHAELNAIRKMQADGQTRIKAVTVFNSCSVTPLLPCNGCIMYILGLHPENVSTLVVTPNGNMLITDVSRFAAGPDLSRKRTSMTGYSVYTEFPENNRGASLYNNPSGSLMPEPAPVTNSQIYGRPPVIMNPPVSAAVRMNRSAAAGKVSAGNVPVAGKQNGVNNILKNKLSALFEEED